MLRWRAAHAAIASLLSACTSFHIGLDPDFAPATLSCAGRTYASPHTANLEVVTWNLHGPPNVAVMTDRLKRIAQAVGDRAPDLVVFQEVWFEGDYRNLVAEMKAYNVIADDPKIVAGALYRLVGFRNGGLVAFLRKGSRWTLAEDDPSKPPAAFSLYESKAPFVITEFDGISGKGFQSFVLTSAHDHHRIQIFNTHLQSQYGDQKRYMGVRMDQVGQLMRSANDDWTSKPRVDTQIVFGDFNTRPDEFLVYGPMTISFDDLTAVPRAELKCAGTSLDYETRRGSEKAVTIEGDWIDYVLARRGTSVIVARFALIESTAMDTPYSDHHGLNLGLTIERRP